MKKYKGSDFGESIVHSVVPIRNEDGKWFSEEELNLSPTQWNMVALNVYKTASITEKFLPPGAYEIGLDERDSKPTFTRKNVIHDNLIRLKGLPEQILSEIQEFWNKEEDFTKLGFLHRRGYLLYGSQGTGKSSLVYAIVDSVIKEGGIVFYCKHPEHFDEGLRLFRKVEQKRNVVCIFEDMDAIVKNYGENILLSILDGENQISNVCNLATTNYPELLDKRLVGRPRRFDRVYKISNLSKIERSAYLKEKLPKGADINEWVKKTDGLSIASISEVIVSVFCFDKNLDEAVEIMNTLVTQKKTSDETEGKLGFAKEEDN